LKPNRGQIRSLDLDPLVHGEIEAADYWINLGEMTCGPRFFADYQPANFVVGGEESEASSGQAFNYAQIETAADNLVQNVMFSPEEAWNDRQVNLLLCSWMVLFGTNAENLRAHPIFAGFSAE
jgi:hypothetical protein